MHRPPWFGLLLFLICWGGGHLSLPAQAFRFQRHTLGKHQQRLDAQVLYEDAQGYLWIGGQTGLYRYDGETYRHLPARAAGVTDTVTAIGTGPDGRLWTGHADGSLCWRSGDSLTLFQPEEGLPRVPITGIQAGPGGILWIATYGEGLYYYRRGRLYNYDTGDGLLTREVYALLIGPAGRLWAATDRGVNRCWLADSLKQLDTLPGPLPDDIILSLSRDPRGGMWIGTYERGPCYVDATGRVVHALPDSVPWPYGPVQALLPIGEEIWVATRGSGLLTLGRQDLRLRARYDRAQGLINNRVFALLQDQAGNVWLSGEKEPLLSVYPYLSLAPAPPLGPLAGNIRCLLAQPDGSRWVATNTQLYFLPGYGHAPQPVTGLDLEAAGGVISMYRDPAGGLWLGTFGGGLFYRSKGKNSWTHFTAADGLPNGNILSLASDGTRLWLATLGGVAHAPLPRDGARPRFEPLDRATTPNLDYVYQILATPGGDLWFATDGGGLVQRTAAGDFRRYKEAEGLSPVIYSLTLDETGALWFVTQDTLLYRYDQAGFQAYGQAEGLSAASLTSVISDGRGHILVVHNGGIDLLDRARGTFSYFGAGWDLGDLDPDLNAYAQDPEGVIWLGSQRGLLRFVPPPPLQTQPATHLDEVWVYLTERADTSQRVFAYQDHHLTFAYTGLWYRQPDAVSYQYQLEGYDLDWVITRDRKVTFPRLSPGSYTFRVRAALNQQFAQAEEVSYTFRIRRAFWQTFWFWGVVLLLVAGTLVAVTQARERNLRHQAHLEQEKIRFQFETLRSQVNPHFLFNSFNTLVSLIEENPRQAVTYANQLSDLFRNMLAYREQNLIPLREELKVLETYFFLQKQRYGDNLHLDIDVPAPALDRQLPPLTLQLLIENAIKHNVIARSRPLTITVRLRPDGCLEVMNPIQAKRSPAPSTRMGLQNIQARYQLLTEAPVSILRKADSFTVIIPLLDQAGPAPVSPASPQT